MPLGQAPNKTLRAPKNFLMSINVKRTSLPQQGIDVCQKNIYFFAQKSCNKSREAEMKMFEV